MMKKGKFYLVLMLVMMLTLTACGGTDEPKPNTPDAKPTAVLLIGNKGDLSFNDSAVRGVEKADAELAMDVTVLEYGTEPDNYEPSVVDAAESGYDIVIVTSTLREYVEQYAPEYPDTTWIMFDSDFDYSSGNYDNVYTILYSANEGSFLGGYIAAKLSETGTLGFLGGMEAPIILDFLKGYEQGAKLANPDVKVLVNYAGSWIDSAKGKELTLAMNSQGADVVFGVAGGTGIGALEAATERELKVIGVDSDQAMIFDASGRMDFAEALPTSVLKNVDNSLFRALDLYLKGELAIGTTEVLGLKELGVGIAKNKYYDKYVTKEIQDEVDALAEQVMNGEIKVESAYN